jgi:hypothetical protein
MADIRVFAHNGWIVHHPNPQTDPEYNEREAPSYVNFEGRRPFIVSPERRHIYLGEPNWYHDDVAQHHHLNDEDEFASWAMPKGYFGGGTQWGNGLMKWYDTPDEGGVPEYHPDVAQALTESGFNIPNPSGEDAEHDSLDSLDFDF